MSDNQNLKPSEVPCALSHSTNTRDLAAAAGSSKDNYIDQENSIDKYSDTACTNVFF